MEYSKDNLEYYPRRITLLLLLAIFLTLSYLELMSYLHPTVMANGKPHDHAYIDGAMAVVLFIPIPYLISKLISNKIPTLSINQCGIEDTRLYHQLIPWQEIKNVDLIITTWFDRTPSFIHIEVSKEFSNELVASTFLNKTNQYFVTRTNDGTVKLAILRPSLFQDIHELKDTISTFWVKYSKPPK